MSLGPYAIEQDYSHYVAYAANTIHAVVSTATKGPVNVPTVCTSVQDFVRKFGPVSPDCYGTYAAQYFLNQASKLWFVRAASETVKAATVVIPGTNSTGTTLAEAATFTAISPGTFYNGYQVVISESETDEEACKLVTLNGKSYSVEVKDGITVNNLADCNSNYFTVTTIADTAVSLTPGTYTFSGGADGIDDISSADYIKACQELQTDNIDMNLFAIPGVSDAEVIKEALSIAENRGDCLFLVDPPYGLTVDGVANWHNGSGEYQHTAFNSSYGALYYDWQRIYDSVNKEYVNVPPSVVVAATIAYSDRTTEVWFPPAGLNRGIVQGVINPVTAPDTNQLNYLYSGTNSVNSIIEDPQAGVCVFGQKTLHRADTALNRVNVRRLLNYLKRIVVAACRHLTFEPNDSITWNQFEDLVEPVLQSIKRRRGVYQYKIVKGDAIVTESDIDNYTMPCKIMIQPTKAAEVIPIYFTITSTGADFNELLEDPEELVSTEYPLYQNPVD